MFCKKCGAEIDDQAVICVKCGCPVSPFQVPKKDTIKKEKPTATTEKPTLSFSVISIIIALFVGLFSCLMIPNTNVAGSFNDTHGNMIYPYYDAIITCIVFAFTMAISITNIVFTFINTKKEKQPSSTLVLSIILNFLTFGLCLAVFLGFMLNYLIVF